MVYWHHVHVGEVMMRNRTAMVATMVVALLLALGCRLVLAQIGPRYAVEVKQQKGLPGALGKPQQGKLELVGKGVTLIRYAGLNILTVGADAEDYSAAAASHWPAADLLVMSPAVTGRYSGLAPLAALHGLNVVLPEPSGGIAVPPQLRFYPMHTWDSLHLRKGKALLRVTAMPGPPGMTQIAGFVLELGNGRASYRVYISCAPLDDGELDALPGRLPGADLALLPVLAQPAPSLVPLRRRQLAPVALTAAGYAFTAIKR